MGHVRIEGGMYNTYTVQSVGSDLSEQDIWRYSGKLGGMSGHILQGQNLRIMRSCVEKNCQSSDELSGKNAFFMNFHQAASTSRSTHTDTAAALLLLQSIFLISVTKLFCYKAFF